MVTLGTHEAAVAAICVISGVLLYLAEGSSTTDNGVTPCPHGAAMCAEGNREAAAALCPYMASKRAASAVASNRWLFCAVAVATVAAGALYFRRLKQ
ncbi:GPI-anchored surface protein, putative [Bodo saltans]|uniref:GPI-anchored surface protein, putative n=1 Tax=Bodo saltans TaxID=75058 RepID=A0A0S4JMK1_BODSA|nr:GPI-anchored surface protein, putative [Bodo saltans]|eukprot:CUG90623.1 GPI-anchored surface protein, putative [Bodo saltans]